MKLTRFIFSRRFELIVTPLSSDKYLQVLEFKTTEKKPSIVNQQHVVYQFKCSFCDENYIGFTMRHLHECCEEHKFNSSSIKKHFCQ